MAEYRRKLRFIPCTTELDPPIHIRDLPRADLERFADKLEALMKKEDTGATTIDVLILDTFVCDGTGQSYDNFKTVEGWEALGLDERDEIMHAVMETRESLGKRMEKRRASLESLQGASGSTEATPTTSPEASSDAS